MTWERIKLKDLGVETRTGFATGKHAGDGEIVHLRPMNVSPQGALVFDDNKFVSSASGSQRVTRGDVLFNNTNSPKWVGKTAWVSSTTPLAFSNHMTRLRGPESRIDSRFLAMQLHHLQSVGYFESICSNHVNQASVSSKRLLEVEVLVPPPDEQRRIVAILEDHLSRLDAANEGLGRAIARLRLLRSSTLAATVEAARQDGTTEFCTIGALARVSAGTTPHRGNSSFYDGGAVPWITSGDLTQGTITRARQFVTEKALSETSLKLLPAGAILVAMYGEGKTRGTAATLAIEATTNQACASIVLDDDGLQPWVRTVLDANYQELRRLAAGGVQPNLNLGLVRAIEVPIPSRATREKLLAHLADFDDARKRLSDELTMADRRSSALRRSLLAAAFAGRLTGGGLYV